MDQQVTRRNLLVGASAAAGALAVGTLATRADGAPLARDGDGIFGPAGEARESQPTGMTASAFTPTPGLAYLVLDPTELLGLDAFDRTVQLLGVRTTAATGVLLTPVRLPIGAILKEVTLLYVSPTTAFTFGAFRMPVGGNYTQLGAPSPALAGGGSLSATASFTEAEVDGSFSYFAFVQFTAANQFVQGIRIGYVPPAQAFVPISPVKRVLDTRLSGGKLQPNEERVVPLGVPSFAKAAVANLTVTETEVAGFVAVFPANVPWPGNSSINWSATNQNLANGVITATDSTGNVRIRGGVNPTHVVIDVQGYLL